MIATCIGCQTTENLITIESDSEKFTICKKCDSALDEEISSENKEILKEEQKMTEKETTTELEDKVGEITTENAHRFSEIQGDTIFVMGSPTEIKEKVEDSESKISNINAKITKITKARDVAQKWIDWHTPRKHKNVLKLKVEQEKLMVVNGIVEASKFTEDEKFSKAELFGQSVDGELRIKIDGKWFNENLQEFVKVNETKMTKRGNRK